MKTTDEILSSGRIIPADAGFDGGSGWITGLDRKKPKRHAVVVWSYGGGWDHVSVSWNNRCPTWDEMCEVKKLFFYPEEVCVQYHPPESEYVNQFPYCLHIWRCQQPGMPMPPSWMVGLKKGQSAESVIKQAEKELAAGEKAKGG